MYRNGHSNNHQNCHELDRNSSVYQQVHDFKNGSRTMQLHSEKEKNNLKQYYQLSTCTVPWMNLRNNLVSKKEPETEVYASLMLLNKSKNMRKECVGLETKIMAALRKSD